MRKDGPQVAPSGAVDPWCTRKSPRPFGKEYLPMTQLDLRSNDEKLADAAATHHVEMWRAAETVRARVSDDAGRQELLGCLGLLDVARPVDR